MSADFHGRSKELLVLTRAAASARSEFIPVYGRRRVGKSELLVHFLRSRPGGIYIVGQQAAAPLQIAAFLAAAAEALGQPLLAGQRPGDWKTALSLTVEAWTGPGKLCIVLDEFQWIVESSPELPSVLQELWDRRWRDDGRILLILCGSYVGFMEREVLGERSPLFGRRTAQMHLKPFTFREARRFHEGWSLADAFRAWAICGGVPAYLKSFDPSRSVEANVQEAVLDEFAPLRREPEFLLREELRDLPSYSAVLVALARGSHTVAEVARESGVPERSVPYYLNQLAELGYVRRRHPLTGAPPGMRHVRFALEDSLLRFWFRFVFPNASALARFGGKSVFAQRIRPELPAFFGVAFEALCREALPLIYADEGIHANAEIGEYWDRDVQLDLVSIRDDGWTDLGECRWADRVSLRAVVGELRQRAARYPNARGATLRLCLFSKVRRDSDEPLVRWYGLPELYAEPG